MTNALIHDFIVQSNKIDAQYDETGALIPGIMLDDPMYVRHLKAYETALEMCSEKEIAADVAKQVHAQLTRGLTVYTRTNASGVYRKQAVYIRTPARLIEMLDWRLIPEYTERKWIDFVNSSQADAEEYAWDAHHFFECIHPFIDGNGRTGRCLLNALRVRRGLEPLVIWFDKRDDYYKRIQQFRENVFVNIEEAKA